MMSLMLLLGLATLSSGGDTAVLSALSTVFSDDHFPDHFLKFAINTCEVLPMDLFFSRIPDELKNININLFTHSARRVYRIQDVRRLLLENPKVNSKRQTTIYVHGWRNHPLDESSQAIVHALLAKDCNVLVVDSSKYMSELYLSASSHVFRIGEALNKFLIRLTERVPVKNINLVGFSLGAHVSGVAGKLFQRHTGSIIERITALDPAKPCFENLEAQRLSKDDAKYVDVIHTNTGTLGMKDAIGHADFYVNGLSGNQPECRSKVIKLDCNHAQAWKLYVTSVKNEGSIMSSQCQSWEELRREQCSGSQAVMGYGSSNHNRGLYYVRTKDTLSRKQRYSDRRLGRNNHRTSRLISRRNF